MILPVVTLWGCINWYGRKQLVLKFVEHAASPLQRKVYKSEILKTSPAVQRSKCEE